MNVFAILGAADPEMAAIESLLAEVEIPYAYATVGGVRCWPGSAYATDVASDLIPVGHTVWRIECDGPKLSSGCEDVVVIDHHRPGDPGYGRLPGDFVAASSLGQTLSQIARRGLLNLGASSGEEPEGLEVGDIFHNTKEWVIVQHPEDGPCPCGDDCCGYARYRVGRIPEDMLFCMAADHCLAAAYRGECPEVDPDRLMQWRIKSRAAFQRRPPAEVLADVESAREILRQAPLLHGEIRDMRGMGTVPELPEAAAREGICFVATDLPSHDKTKVVCQSGSPAQIAWFLDEWGPAHGLHDMYGDAARGFAGGYASND